VKTDVEELSPTRVRLTVEVPFDELKPNLDQAYREVGRQVRIPGFRPGHVPRQVLDQRVGRSVVLEQAINEAVPELYSKAVREAQVFALGQPEVEITRLDDGEQMAFTAEVDVRPKFEIPDLDGLQVVVDDAEVGPDQVEEYLGALRERFASLRAPTGQRRLATTCRSTWRLRWTASPSTMLRRPAFPTRWAAARFWTGLTTSWSAWPLRKPRPSRPSWPAASMPEAWPTSR